MPEGLLRAERRRARARVSDSISRGVRKGSESDIVGRMYKERTEISKYAAGSRMMSAERRNKRGNKRRN